MQISFQDFVPEAKTEGFFNTEYETLQETVEKVNQWIAESNIRVLNVETIIRPTNDNETTNNEVASVYEYVSWYQFVRVWYVVE